MKMKVSPLMKHLLKHNKRFLVFQGGSGSSKTYTILQYFIIKCMNEWDNKTIDIIRRTTPSLKRSVMFDFFRILNNLNMYEPEKHNSHSDYYEDNNKG